MRSSFANQGQICLCGSRILVERPIYDRFVKAFVAKTKQLRVGPPDQPGVQIGAVVSQAHRDKILSYIQLAIDEGGTVECGGSSPTMEGDAKGGFYVNPTIITGLEMACRTNQEEIFGPVVTIMPLRYRGAGAGIGQCHHLWPECYGMDKRPQACPPGCQRGCMQGLFG